MCDVVFCSVFSVIDGAALRIDDKLRVAKERREEQEKQHGDKAKYFTQQVLATLDVQATIGTHNTKTIRNTVFTNSEVVICIIY